MSDVSAVFAGRHRGIGRVLAPLARQVWMIALIVCVGVLATLAYGRMQTPLYEASSVVQVQPGTDLAQVAGKLLSRNNLLSMATRHGLALTGSRDKTVVQLRRAISIHDLTSQAGQTLGYAPQVAGLIVAVLLPDAEVSARVANDLAQQILDFGNAGLLDEHQGSLDFYRRDEQRLWQELSAFRAEQDQAAGTVGGRRVCGRGAAAGDADAGPI